MWKLEYKSLKSCQQQRRNGGLPVEVDIPPLSIYPSHVNVNQHCHSE